MARRKRPQKNKQANTLRIIGGKWRSRKLKLVNAQGMRPTPDRIRETLFNWLQNNIHDARCLDLFAGSGALGLEALSRGASEVVFVEKNSVVANQLQANLQVLTPEVAVINADALNFLEEQSSTEQKPFDIIFLDPPYRQGLVEHSLNLLTEKNLIGQNTLIYLEYEAEETFDWSMLKLKTLKETSAGQVKSLLVQISD